MTTLDSPPGALRTMLTEAAPQPAAIATFLDGLTHAERVIAVRGLGRWQLQALYQRVEGYGELGLNDLVPKNTPPFTPVRHYGQNTLPMFREFEKRFYRMDDPEAVGGANFQAFAAFTGPGYFVAARDPERPEILIDYRRLPDKAPAGWPKIRGNERGLSRAVYGFMVDRLRRVSEHVSIGSAFRDGKPVGAYFALCRELS